ncbi:unnamed protein product, partial [Meganyctiphanes norvegica]
MRPIEIIIINQTWYMRHRHQCQDAPMLPIYSVRARCQNLFRRRARCTLSHEKVVLSYLSRLARYTRPVKESRVQAAGSRHCRCGDAQGERHTCFSNRLCEFDKYQCMTELKRLSEFGKYQCIPQLISKREHSECREGSAARAPCQVVVCSGEGICECGVCKCHSNGTYNGQFCEDCPTCVGGLCEEYRDCAQFGGFGTGRFTQQVFERNCSSLKIKKEDDLKVFDDSIESRRREFILHDSTQDNVSVFFTNRMIQARRASTYAVDTVDLCMYGNYILAIIIGVIAAIVAIGLLTLLIWKLLTTLHDQREYAKFEEDRKAAQWQTEENPIYHSATTTTVNPAFVK